MQTKDVVRKCRRLARRYCVTDGEDFRLKDYDADDTGDLKSEDKPRAQQALELGRETLAHYQEKLYAQDKWALLLIFQAMDAAGKDSAIKHVMTGVNPQGCQVTSFKVPSSEELDHDYLWRCARALPERGRIGIFNRSYYEEVLVVRVHPEFLQGQKLPQELIKENIWEQRYDDIRHNERYLSHNGIVVRKFFLNVSKAEQKARFLERLKEPEKHWKFSLGDLHEREHWSEYMEAYEDMIRHTATKQAPWFVVPADNKWFTRVVVVSAIVDALDSLDLQFPEASKRQQKELAAARRALLKGK